MNHTQQQLSFVIACIALCILVIIICILIDKLFDKRRNSYQPASDLKGLPPGAEKPHRTQRIDRLVASIMIVDKNPKTLTQAVRTAIEYVDEVDRQEAINAAYKSSAFAAKKAGYVCEADRWPSNKPCKPGMKQAPAPPAAPPLRERNECKRPEPSPVRCCAGYPCKTCTCIYFIPYKGRLPKDL